MPGLSADELSAIVSATFAEFDDIARDAPSLRAQHAYIPAVDAHPSTPTAPSPSRVSKPTSFAASIIRKVKSHASALPFVSISPVPRPSTPKAHVVPTSFLPSPGPSFPPSPPPKRPRSRTRSLPRILFKRQPSSHKASPPPPVSRVPRRPVHPSTVPLKSHLDVSSPGPSVRGRDASQRPREIPRLPSVYEMPSSLERSIGSSNAGIVPVSSNSVRPCAPPPLPKSRLVLSTKPREKTSSPKPSACTGSSNNLDYCSHSDTLWTPALTQSSPSRSSRRSPASVASSSDRIPLTPEELDRPITPEDDPFRKDDLMLSSQNSWRTVASTTGSDRVFHPLHVNAKGRRQLYKTHSSPKLETLFLQPESASASAPLLRPLPLSTRSDSLPPPSPLLLPFPLPPDCAGDAITLRVATPPPRPPPQQPLPRTPPSAGIRPRLGSRQRKDSERTILFRPKHTRSHSRSRPLRADAAAAIAHVMRGSPRSGLRGKPPGENVRCAVDEMFNGGQVPFTNPWTDSFFINLGEEEEVAEPDSDIEPERCFNTTKAMKKVSVASQATTRSGWTATTCQSSSSGTSQATIVTAATTMSAHPSPLAAFFDDSGNVSQSCTELDPSPFPRSPAQITRRPFTGVRLLPDRRPIPRLLHLGAIPVCLEALNWAAFRAFCMREDVVLQADGCNAQNADVHVEILDHADSVEVSLCIRSLPVPCAREYLPAIPRMSPIEIDASFEWFKVLDTQASDDGRKTRQEKTVEEQAGCPVLSFELRLPTTLGALGRKAGELGLMSGVGSDPAEDNSMVVERSGWFE